MTTPLFCLLLFALWTVCLIIFCVGGYRVWAVLARGKAPNAFPADVAHEGPAWYRRAIRAHMNCVENLPVFGAVVVVATLAKVSSPWLDTWAWVYVAARAGQTLIHLASTSPTAVHVRFGFFAAQLFCVSAMAWLALLGSNT